MNTTTKMSPQEIEDRATEKMLKNIKTKTKAVKMTKSILDTPVLPSWYTGSDLITPINRYEEVVKQRLAETYKDSPTADPQVQVLEGPKNWKIVVTTYGQRSVHSFVERSTGNILKPAGWNAPAKGVRGNIKDEDDGASALDAYGVRYLR
jgi:hypothetical protein